MGEKFHAVNQETQGNALNVGLNRGDISPLALSVLDMLCDVVHHTHNREFRRVTVVDLANHVFNLFYNRRSPNICIAYLGANDFIDVCEIDIAPFEDYFEYTGSLNDEKYIQFRSIFVEALLFELVTFEAISMYMKSSKDNENEIKWYISVRDSILELEDAVSSDHHKRFGLNLICKKDYVDGAIKVTDIQNDHFIADIHYLNYNQVIGFDLGLLAYIVLGDLYMEDKTPIMINVLQLIVDCLEYNTREQDNKNLKKIKSDN